MLRSDHRELRNSYDMLIWWVVVICDTDKAIALAWDWYWACNLAIACQYWRIVISLVTGVSHGQGCWSSQVSGVFCPHSEGSQDSLRRGDQSCSMSCPNDPEKFNAKDMRNTLKFRRTSSGIQSTSTSIFRILGPRYREHIVLKIVIIQYQNVSVSC